MKLTSFLLILFYVLFNISLLNSQAITGKVMDASNGNFLPDLEVNINDKVFLTDAGGKFYAENTFGDSILMSISTRGYRDYSLKIDNINKESINLGMLFLETSSDIVPSLDDQYVIASGQLDIVELDESIPSLLSASWDPFGSNANYNFGVTRFNPRGLSQDYSYLYLNGLPFNNLSNGRYFFSLWGGLNDVFRSEYAQHGLNVTDFGIGGFAGLQDVDLRASSQRKQTQATMSFSNKTYLYRAMFTHSSGLNPKGWAYSISLSRRWGDGGYVEGTYYDNYAYFVSLEKRLGDRHALNLVAFASPTVRGRASAATQEMYDLLGTNYYNPNWGLQNGKVRNSREYRTHQPVFILRHDFNINDQTQISTSAGLQTGRYGSTRLDWLEASDPRPDYYRNLPYANRDQPVSAATIAEKYRTDINTSQINWDELIAINRDRVYTVIDPNGNEANNFDENISAYIVEEQRYDNQKMVFQSHVNHRFNDYLAFNGGIQFQYDLNHNFKLVDDLLGGSYYLDIDDFALRDFPDDYSIIQNDIDNPNRLLVEGDKFGYDYEIHNRNANAWMSIQSQLKKIDFDISASIQHTSFWRNGLVANGKFPETSKGESEHQSFLHGTAKLGMTYKINGRNYLYGNIAYQSRPPFSRYAFLSPQIRNDVVPDLENENVMGGEIGYIYRHPNLNTRITGFYSRSENGINSVSFYHDEERSFVNYSIKGIDRVNYGVELGIDYKLSQVLSLGYAGAIGEYYFDSRPTVTITQDNNANILVQDRTVYLEGYNLPGIPQIAHTMSLTFRSPHFWSLSLSANYFDDSFIDPNPDRRTSLAVDGVSPTENSELYNNILGQEKFDKAITMNFFGRWSKKINNSYLIFMLGVDNILNKQDFKIGGYEQLRFDFEGKDTQRFDSRYYYAFGRTYFLSIAYRI